MLVRDTVQMVVLTDGIVSRAGFCPGLATLLALLATACSGGSAVPRESITVFEGVVGPEGGSVVVPDGEHAGVGLTVPPGAVAAPTRFTVRTEIRNSQVLSLFPVYRFEPANLVASLPLLVTLRAGDPLQASAVDTLCFRQTGSAEPWNVVVDCVAESRTGMVTAATDRLGDFVVWNSVLHRLFTHDRRTLDSATPSPIETFPTGPMLVQNGSERMLVGRGSAAAFWSSPSAENLLILHGLVGSPLDFLGRDDLAQSLSPTTANVLFYLYPSASGVAATANAFYNEIQARRQPGFRCSILGHSLGGLVARYMLEKSADDPARPGYREQDEPLTDVVVNLILLAVPNAGSEIGGALLGTLVPQVPPAELGLVQAASDLSFGPEAITIRMNATYVDNPTRYFVLYGDWNGTGSDGVVTTASALALPLFTPETSTRFAAGHNELHIAAGALGVAKRIDQILGLP